MFGCRFMSTQEAVLNLEDWIGPARLIVTVTSRTKLIFVRMNVLLSCPAKTGNWLGIVPVGAMPKSKPKTAIYHPPKKGMPYLVVTVSAGGAVVATAVNSKDEARILASSKIRQVEIDTASPQGDGS